MCNANNVYNICKFVATNYSVIHDTLYTKVPTVDTRHTFMILETWQMLTNQVFELE